jgi:hypothetical protein
MVEPANAMKDGRVTTALPDLWNVLSSIALTVVTQTQFNATDALRVTTMIRTTHPIVAYDVITHARPVAMARPRVV